MEEAENEYQYLSLTGKCWMLELFPIMRSEGCGTHALYRRTTVSLDVRGEID
jgi:hypothetical protein